MKLSKIAVFDPGKMTGVAKFLVEDKTVVGWSSYELDLEQTYKFMFDEIPKCTEVVIERFAIGMGTAKKTPAYWSLELIGLAKALCWQNNIPITVQTPGDAKMFSTDAKLKAVGWWHKGGAGHANDALRHGMLYVGKTFGWDSVH